MSQNLIYYIFGILFIFNVLVSLLRNLHFLQLKEYRFDRFWTFLKYEQGFKKLLTPFSSIGIIISVFSIILNHSLLFGIGLVFLMASNLYVIMTKGIFRPVKTKKSLLIFIVTLFLLSLSTISNPSITKLNLNLLLSVPLLFIVTSFFYPITKLSKEYFIRKAAQKVKKYPNIKIVGITGSYGKSSTKEFLYQILSQHFRTSKTPKNINTEIGVAKYILGENLSDTEVLIVEMGAYKVGEIRKICQITPPNISILTAIHNQHLSLYGSQKNIAKTKLEIINHAAKNATFIYNNDTPGSHYIKELKDPLPPNTLVVSSKTNLSSIEQTQDKLKFILDNNTYISPIVGPHFAENLSLAIKASLELGVSIQDVKTSLAKTTLPENTFSIKSGINNSIVLDDSYNSSPQGFQAAINTASLIKHSGKKILITRGMLELGPDEEKEHLQIAQKATHVFDLIITTSFTTHQYFSSQILEEKLKYLPEIDQLIEVLGDNLSQNDLILLENKVPKQLKDFLITSK